MPNHYYLPHRKYYILDTKDCVSTEKIRHLTETCCFDSKDNRERRKRAQDLAKEFNVSAQNIAGAWALNQPFPSFALIGPRKIEEINTSLPSLDISITKEKSNWLNLN